jgi:colanic acid/amylovoran biosynthesis glycosyltransferase
VVRTFHLPESKCQVFWNALQDPLANPGFVAKAKAAGSDPRRFICVGRFDPSKGQDIALRAIAKVVRRLPEISLELVGDGPTRKTCENLARELGITDRCTFTGRLAHDDVLLRLASARATIAPSLAEAFGLVNIESMALGVPVIGSNTGGIAEILRDGADGLLFPPGDYEELASQITQIAENESLRNQVGEACRRRFLEHFELSQAVKSQADWIAAVISRSV